MPDVKFDFRDLKCPSRCVIDAYNAYMSQHGASGHATFAVPVVELTSDGQPLSEPVVMLSAVITENEITLIGDSPLSSERVAIHLPFRDEQAVDFTILETIRYQSAWVFRGALASAD